MAQIVLSSLVLGLALAFGLMASRTFPAFMGSLRKLTGLLSEEKLLRFAKDGDLEKVSKQLAGGMRGIAKDDKGFTPLHHAVQRRKLEMTQLLLEAKVDVNAKNMLGLSALHHACLLGEAATAKLLLAAPGVDVNMLAGGKLAATALDLVIYRAMGGQIRGVNEIDHLGDVNPRASTEETVELIKVLASAPNINMNCKEAEYVTWHGQSGTPLECAVQLQSVPVLEALLRAPGIDVNARGRSGAPLHLASSPEIAQLLLAVPEIDANLKEAPRSGTGWERTPLHIAAQKDNVELVKVLVASPKVDVNARDRDGMTALRLAQLLDTSQAMQEILREAGATAASKRALNPE